MRHSPLLALLPLSACSLFGGPHEAVYSAWDAWEAGDLTAFEAAVDLDAVAPQVAAFCLEVRTREGWVQDQFEPDAPGDGLGRALTEGILDALGSAAVEGVADAVREDFGGPAAGEVCPGVTLSRPEPIGWLRSLGEDSVRIPVAVQGVEAEATVLVREVAGQPRVVSVDLDDARVALRSAQDRLLQEEARRRLAELGPDHPEHWAALEIYTLRHPDDGELAERFRARAEPILSAASDLQVTRSWLDRAGVLGMKRVARVEVSNQGGVPTRDFKVRFTFLDDQGIPRQSAQGERAAVGSIQARVEPGQTDQGPEILFSVLQWPAIAQVNAQVVEVTWQDGQRWVHPAVEAGFW